MLPRVGSKRTEGLKALDAPSPAPWVRPPAWAAGAAAGFTGSKEPRKVDPVIEESHWREHFTAEPYYDATYAFEDYLPAWRTGWEGIGKYPGKSFEQAERDLQSDFHWNRGQSRLLWDQAKPAVRAAFER